MSSAAVVAQTIVQPRHYAGRGNYEVDGQQAAEHDVDDRAGHEPLVAALQSDNHVRVIEGKENCADDPDGNDHLGHPRIKLDRISIEVFVPI